MNGLPPQNVEMEQSVLGAILQDNDTFAELVDTLQEDDFYRDAHRLLYRAMRDLFQDNIPIDVLSVNEWLKKKDRLDAIGGPAYLAELIELVPTVAHVDYHARVVREKSVLRAVIQMTNDIVVECHEEDADADKLIDRAETRILDVRQAASGGAFQTAAAGVRDALHHLEQLAASSGEVTGLATGFSDLDKLTGGLQSGNMLVVAGRPSMGKTTFALNIAAHVAQGKNPVAIFSLEMTARELWLRLLSAETQINSEKFRRGKLGKEEWRRLTDAASTFHATKLFMSDSVVTVGGIRTQARRIKAQAGGLSMVIVDYLQLLTGQGRAESRQQEVSALSRALKRLAVELDCVVVAVSQLNRAPESRSGNKPMLADLRESGAIEQDADLVALLYRDEAYNTDSDDRGVAEINIAKHRNGPTGTLQLAFRSEFTRFDNLARQARGSADGPLRRSADGRLQSSNGYDAAGNPPNPPIQERLGWRLQRKS